LHLNVLATSAVYTGFAHAGRVVSGVNACLLIKHACEICFRTTTSFAHVEYGICVHWLCQDQFPMI
jgi:hypothetical protein